VRVRALAATVLLAVLAAASPGAAQDDPWREREQVRAQQGAVVADLDVLRAQDAEIEAALASLAMQIAEGQALLAEAQHAVAVAEARLADARAAVARTQASILVQERNIEQLAVQAYMGSGTSSELGALLTAEDLGEAAERMVVVDSVATDIDGAIEELEATRERLEDQRRAADRAARDATARRAEAEQHLADLDAARATQETFAAEVETRIEARLAEAAALADLDARLSAELQARQEALAAALAAARPPSGGGDTRVPPVLVDPADLRVVRGITVHVSIEAQLEAMLAAAEADGILLAGGGYRSSDAQIALRQAHCPDVWDSPPSACTPPTARPGSSLHERGLAIDFTYLDQGISTQDNPAFVWLAANAERFGFYNLPSEPWHWSTTGE
jgi:D-alanyl-D-alanine carboxypeptidase